jgi:hypothetical protein
MTLGSGNMSLAVELPHGEELNEWLAVNTIEFYNEISILYGTLMEVNIYITYKKKEINLTIDLFIILFFQQKTKFLLKFAIYSNCLLVLYTIALPYYVSWT